MGESPDLLQQALVASGLVVLIADDEGVVVRASDGAVERLGGDPVVGRTLFDLCAGVGPSVLEDLLAGRRPTIVTEVRDRIPALTETGDAMPVRLVAMGDDRHIVATIGDVPRSANRLGDALHLVQASSAEGFWEWDHVSGAVWWSAEVSSMLGGPARASVDSVEARFEDRVHPDDLPAVAMATQRALASPEPVYEVEARVRTEAGDWRWFLIRGACERSESGEATRVVGTMLDIHDRVTAEQRVKASEARYRRLANSLPQFVWSATPDGSVDELNERFYEVTGLPRDLVGDEAWAPAIHPDDLDGMIATWQESLRTGDPYEVTFRCRVHGDYRWFLAQARPEFDASGAVTRWFGTGTDIHDARMAQIARDESRVRLASTVDGADLGIWEWSVDDDGLVINERWAGILGYTRAELEPVDVDTWRRHCHPEDLERANEAMVRHLRGETERYDVEVRMQHRDGRYVWVRSCGRVLEHSPDGQARRMFGLHEDITARRAMEVRLRESEQQFRRIFEESRDAVLLLEDGCVTDANMAAAVMFGELDPGAMRGECLVVRSPDRQPDGATSDAALSARFAEVGRDGSSRFEWMHVRADGSEFWVETILTALPSSDGTVVHAVLRDVGERKRLESSLQRSIVAAREASRAKSEFLANMSHEIRTPMTAILGFVGLVQRDLETGDSTVILGEAMETIRRNGEHLLDLINDILDLSRIEAGRMELERLPVSPVAVIDEVVELMKMRAESKGLALRVELGAGLPAAIDTDARRLRQVLLNLVGNAIKFTHVGEVVVRADAVQDVEVGAGRLRLTVQDTGIGMSEGQLDEIFEAFTQADASTTREYGGTGLGLRISASLVEMMGGSIGVRSELGVGSTFTVDLTAPVPEPGVGDETEDAVVVAPPPAAERSPGADASEGPLEPTFDPTDESPLNGRRILVADDADDIRSVLRLMLLAAGAEPDMVHDGLEAVRAADQAQSEGRPYDAILLDMQMPLLDGAGTTDRLRATGHDMPIIAVTAHAMAGDRERCLAMGCDAYLAKPVSPEQVVRTVRTLLDRAPDLGPR